MKRGPATGITPASEFHCTDSENLNQLLHLTFLKTKLSMQQFSQQSTIKKSLRINGKEIGQSPVIGACVPYPQHSL